MFRQSEITTGYPLLSDVIRDVEPLVTWLANGIELYHFVQSLMASYPTSSRDDQADVDEVTNRLEGIVVYCFQQTIYYITKVYDFSPIILPINYTTLQLRL